MNSSHPARNTHIRLPGQSGHIILFLVMLLIVGCASNSHFDATRHSETSPPVPHKFAIVNASPHVINSIKYKPCGTENNHFQHLTENLRPNQKFSINIYSQCVDLMATNAFKKKLVHVKNVDLDKIKTWTIK